MFSFKKIVNFVNKNKVLMVFVLAMGLYSILAPLWSDADGTYLIKASIRGVSNPFAIYDEWSYGPFFYGWGPFYSWILLLIHPVFKFLGYTIQSINEGWAINFFTLFLFKWLTKIPFVLAGGLIFYKMYGLKGAVLWLFNPLILWFVVMCGLNDIYPAFFLALGLYFLKKDKTILFVLSMAVALLAKQTIQIAFPVLILMLIFSKGYKSIFYIILLFLPNYVLTLPYKLYSLTYQELMRVNFWQRFPIHLGFVFQQQGTAIAANYYTNIILFSCLLALLIIKKPRLNLINFCLWSAPLYLIYYASSGFIFERWITTALPLLIVSTIIFVKLFNKNVIYLFFGISILPALIQFGWRGNLLSFPGFTNIFNRPELSPMKLAEYFLSVETGLIICFIILTVNTVSKLGDKDFAI